MLRPVTSGETSGCCLQHMLLYIGPYLFVMSSCD